MSKQPKTETYIARAPWVAGARVNIGDEVQLTPAQAKYEPVTPKATPAPRRAAKAGETASK